LALWKFKACPCVDARCSQRRFLEKPAYAGTAGYQRQADTGGPETGTSVHAVGLDGTDELVVEILLPKEG